MNLPLLLCIALLCGGCVPRMIMRSQDQEHYSHYVEETQKLNLERKKAKLEPVKVMTFQEWSGNK